MKVASIYLLATFISRTRGFQLKSPSIYQRNLSTFSSNIKYQTRDKCWRPTIQDVERISWGKPAKKKGTGSRGVPHRLNENERFLFDQARRKGFLEISGSGWRSQRRDAPLVNSYRSLCDARGQVCIILHKGSTGVDDLVVDLSPLRLPDTFDTLADDVVQFVNVATSYVESDEDHAEIEKVDEEAWDNRPIYQLPSHCISWEVERSDGKTLAKTLAKQFQTIEEKASKSKKPNHVKPGKNRRHGGYGIG